MDKFDKFAKFSYSILKRMNEIHDLELRRKNARVMEIAQGKFTARFLESASLRRLIEYKFRQVLAMQRKFNKENPLEAENVVLGYLSDYEGFDECKLVLERIAENNRKNAEKYEKHKQLEDEEKQKQVDEIVKNLIDKKTRLVTQIPDLSGKPN